MASGASWIGSRGAITTGIATGTETGMGTVGGPARAVGTGIAAETVETGCTGLLADMGTVGCADMPG